MADWRSTTLGEVITAGGGWIQTGPFGSQLHASDYVDVGIPCIMPVNMRENRVDLSGIALISEKDAARLSRHLVQEGDIVYSRRGDVTQKALIGKEEVGYFCGTGCLLVRPGHAIDPKFLTYYMSTPSIKDWLVSQSVGATMPNLNTGILAKVPLRIPDRTSQKRIASVLSALDDKIALNTRINAELEAMAKLLYDYWFVQFDFPNAKGKPYKSSGGAMVYNAELKREVPEGWVIENLAECCDIIDCLHSKKSEFHFEDEASYLLQLENIKDDGLLDLASKYYVTKAEYATWTTRIEVHDGDILITNAGRVGATAQVPSGVVSGIGRNITAIRPKSIQPTYLFLAFRGEDMRRQILWNSDSGAFFKSLNVKGIKQLYVARPGKKLEEEFEKMVFPIRRMREVNQVQNQELTTLRDWLLPMLMNGQVVVGEAEEMVGLAMAAEGAGKYGKR